MSISVKSPCSQTTRLQIWRATQSGALLPRNPALSYYHETETDEFGYVPNAAGEAAIDLDVGNFLRSPETVNESWRAGATIRWSFRVPTLRNVDKRPRYDFAKAYGHNGYFKSLKEIVHFYNTRDLLPKCKGGATGEKVYVLAPAGDSAKPQSDVLQSRLSDQQENDLVAFLKTLTMATRSNRSA